MSARDYDAILFDLGQVIMRIDFNRVMERWAEYAGCDASQLHQRFSLDEPYMKHEVGLISHTEYFDSLRRSLQIDLTDDQFLDGWNRIFIEEMPGIDRLLSQLKHQVPVYAFSNTNLAHQAIWSASRVLCIPSADWNT